MGRETAAVINDLEGRSSIDQNHGFYSTRVRRLHDDTRLDSTGSAGDPGSVQREGADLNTEGVSAEALEAWTAAGDRLGAVDEARRLLYLLIAVPTAERAAVLGLSLPELDAILVPALAAETTRLRREITRVRTAVETARTLNIRSRDGCELVVALGDRPWLDDDGVITAENQERGA